MKPLMGNRKYPIMGQDLDQKEQKRVVYLKAQKLQILNHLECPPDTHKWLDFLSI